MGITKTVVIKESNGDVKCYTFKVTQTMNDGEMFSVDNKLFILKVVHKRFRREGDDVVCYLNDSEIDKLFKNIVNTPTFVAISFQSDEVEGKEKRVTGAGFKRPNGGFGDFVIRKIKDRIPENWPSALKSRIIKERSLMNNAESLLKDLASKIQSTQNSIDGATTVQNTKQQEVDDLDEKKKKLEEVVEKEKIEIQRKKEEYERKIREEGGQVEKILKEAQEEGRLALYKLSQNKMVSYKENSTNTNGLYHFEFENKEFCVKECKDDKVNVLDINTVGRGKNKMKQMNVKSIGTIKKDKNHDFSNTYEVLDTLAKEQSVNVFDVDIPKDYNKRVFPVVVCHLSQIGNDVNLPLVFPVEVPRCDNVTEYIYGNGYNKKSKCQNGIIVLHVHQGGVVEYNTLKVKSEEITFQNDGNDKEETEKEEVSDTGLNEKIEKVEKIEQVDTLSKEQSHVITNTVNTILITGKEKPNEVKEEPEIQDILEEKDKTCDNDEEKKTTPPKNNNESFKKVEKIEKGEDKQEKTNDISDIINCETMSFDDMICDQWEDLKYSKKNKKLEFIPCKECPYKKSIGSVYIFEKDNARYQVSFNKDIGKFSVQEKDGVDSYIYNVEKNEEKKSFVTDTSFNLTKILEKNKKSPSQKVFGVVAGIYQWKNSKYEEKTMDIIIPLNKDCIGKNFIFKVSEKLVYKFSIN
ncbi:hypothetical protein EIN_487750 [Entamoeba invadens IP1]|uniref:Uncharacterized protein n=1 Tax=Entamoeba invadens IP1 TaxID=370355 RepID=A0A0A1UAU2_ENTIV|nr:hypothetical protein EIN_487750 [Entamoeba invadens IP1]ELP89273.1 hypothetical protein EIN_487750 [Entamoeba invadens IP1]|eukprot:XP_004256044.1 hypothetical protein EIN_487750 [Entamoeba invadens IP1]